MADTCARNDVDMLETAHQPDVHTALLKLRSLHDGDMGVVETIACGAAAIPELKEILFAREPSGIYETRRHAVEALAGLHALNTLREFLAAHRDIQDPVERTGEDAVMNAAARALGRAPDTRDLPMLLHLVRERPLAGVIETLGKFRQPGALPYFIQALGDDFLRPSAEDAVLKLGRRAVRSLVHAALDKDPLDGRETSSSIGRRRSVLRLLGKLPIRREDLPPAFYRLVDDEDGWIGLLVTNLSRAHLSEAQIAHALRASIRHLKTADDLLAREIEDLLVAYYPLVATDIAEMEAQHHEILPVWRIKDRTYPTLERVRKRVGVSTSEVAHG
jgi:hypothetical protein